MAFLSVNVLGIINDIPFYEFMYIIYNRILYTSKN